MAYIYINVYTGAASL